MPRDPKRPRLGRGLSSLIRASTEPEPLGHYQPEASVAPADEPTQPTQAPPKEQAIATLPLDRIEPNPYQPRRAFDEDLLAQLADSLRAHGLLQPVLVAPVPDAAGAPRYRLIAGERRLRAAQRAGFPQVPCIVRSASRQETLELALVENLHRTDLNPIERASAYRDLMDRFGLTQEQLAQRVMQPRATVANYLRLLDLCDDAQACVVSGELSFGHAKVLAGLAGQPELQANLATRCVREGLSVRQLEQLVRAPQEGEAAAPTKQGRAPVSKPPYLADLEQQLAAALGAKVSIRTGRARHRGKIVIEYSGLEDFDRILAALGVSVDS
jgi:ParB family chromosome partitioning protein